MHLSKYNIFTPIKDSDNYILMNLLSGNADIVEPDKVKEINDKNFTDLNEYIEKGYLVDPKEEELLYKRQYLEFLKKRDNGEVQIFFVTNYSCNFSCSYCYQSEYHWDETANAEEVVEAFFKYIDRTFTDRKKYITIFGGEPLLNSESSRNKIELILYEANKRGMDVAIVTNGYNLIDYIDILKKGSIREIQVTLDGTENIHNKRRSLKNGSPTFTRIVDGIDMALKNNIPVNLRMVLDKENVTDLPEFSCFAIDKEWTKNQNFKTQLGRNYELHHCHSDNSRLYDRAELYEDIYTLIQEYPEILEFHKPAYSISRFLFENGELPDPLFDSCPGCRTEWAFDFTGSIYPCTASVGKEGESVGKFFPEIKLNEDKIDSWEERDVLTIPQCRDCSLQHLCGAGCGAVAKNQNGSIHSPDCRPVDKLIGMGISLYFEKEIEDVRKNTVHKCC